MFDTETKCDQYYNDYDYSLADLTILLPKKQPELWSKKNWVTDEDSTLMSRAILRRLTHTHTHTHTHTRLYVYIYINIYIDII